MTHPHTRDWASQRLAISLIIMLAFAGFEFGIGWFTGLVAITADGMNMLSHSAYIGVALVAQVLVLLFPSKKRLLLEGIGGLLVALFMMMMAVTVFTGHEHHGTAHTHGMGHHHTQGLVMVSVGLISLLVHAGVGRILYVGRERLLVHGACIYIVSHTLMAGAMIASGLLLSLFGWQSIDMWLSFGIATFMLLSGLRLLWLSGRNLC